MLPSELHTKIVRLAKQRDLSISQLERNAGFALGTIKCWKNAFPAFDKVYKVAECLNVSVDYLCGRTKNELLHLTEYPTDTALKVIRAAQTHNMSDSAANIIVAMIETIVKELG